jgi:hypothetical protein
VVIAELVFPEEVVEKVGARGISEAAIVQIVANGAVLARNPRPRSKGSRWLLGPTDGGELLTVVVEPTADDGVWRVLTAWRSSRAQISYYRQRRR